MSRRRRKSGIPGLSFSWKRATGVTSAKRRIARKTGIPTTRSGRHNKVGRMVLTGGGCCIFPMMFILLISIAFLSTIM